MNKIISFKKFFFLHFYENIFKYHPLAQSLFLKRTISFKFPSFLNIEPTNHCNAFCIICPRDKMNRSLGFIDYDLFKKIIDEVSLHRLPGQLTLNKDGEPLLHPKIEKLISYAKEKNSAHRIEVYTNGILLDRKMSEKLIKSGLDILYLSLDAGSPKTYFKIKGIDLFGKVKKNILDFIEIKKKLGASKPLLVVKMVETLDNFKEKEKFKKFWSKKADNVIISSFHTWEGSIKDRGVGGEKRERYPCPVPWYNPVINWNGLVSACCVNINENELIMGDIRKESLKEIWQSKNYKKLRKAHLRQDYTFFPTCQRCGFWKILPNLSSFLENLEQRK